MFGSTEFKWEQSKIRLGESWIFLASSKNVKINENLGENEKNQLYSLVDSFSDIFAHDPKAPRACTVVKHEIRSESSKVVRDKVRNYPTKWAHCVDSQVKEMLENNIIEPSTSPCNSNPLLVDKKDSSKRFVIDFRSLNKTTCRDDYPLPNVDEMISKAFGCSLFTQMDLASGYWGIVIEEPDRPKTAFSVQRGKFQFVRMPFGLKNAQSTFQRNMDFVVEECKKRGAVGLDAYNVDNIIVMSKCFEEHFKTLQIVCEVMDECNLSLRRDKCEFASSEIEFLGFILNGKEIKPSPGNITKIKEFQAPKSRKELQQFLCITNYNRRFIERYSELCSPLTRLTSTKIDFIWSDVEQKAFDNLKKEFHNALSLFLPDWNRPFIIRTDASSIAVGSVLGQSFPYGSFKPIGYHSESLSKTARRWSTSERELYAILSASRKWKVYCYQKIVFYTDHQPLKTIHQQKDPRGKIGRWIMELENLDYEIKYLKGTDNSEADYLSRIEGSDLPNETEAIYSIDFSNQDVSQIIVKAHKDDPVIQDVVEALKKGQTISKGPYRGYPNINIKDGLFCKGARIVVPPEITNLVIKELHGQTHPGTENSVLLISSRFY